MKHVSADDPGSTAYVWLLASVAALGGLLFGYDTAVVSGAIGFLAQRFQLGDLGMGWAASCALLGCIIGAASAGPLSDGLTWRQYVSILFAFLCLLAANLVVFFLTSCFSDAFIVIKWTLVIAQVLLLFGLAVTLVLLILGLFINSRKKVLIVCAVLFLVSALGVAFAPNLTCLVVFRIAGGVAIGAASLASPLYIAEVAPARIRGRMVSLNQLAIVSGMVIVYFVNALIANLGDNAWNVAAGWRWMFGSGALPAVFFFVLLFLVPESPRWLTEHGRDREALAVLERIGGRQEAAAQIEDIRSVLVQESGSLGQLIEPGMRLPLVVALVLAVLQQITGINVVLYYAPEIFKTTGVNVTQAINDTVIVGVVNMLFTLVAIWTVDKLGRKPLLLIGSTGMGVSLALLGGALAGKQFEGPWVLLCLLGYVAAFAMAMGPVVWVIIAEIFPTRVRGRAMSIATVCLWTACYGVSQTFPWMLKHLEGPLTFWFYAAMCLLAVLFIAFCVPETKGKTLEEIERSWMRQ